MRISNESMIGKRFGRLVVERQVGDYLTPKGAKYARFHCKCDCGGECDVLKYSLTSGAQTGCGCVRREAIQKMWGDEERREKLNAWKSTNKHFKEIMRRQLEERRKDPEWQRKQREATQTKEFRQKCRINGLKQANELRDRSITHGVWSRHPRLARTINNHWRCCYNPNVKGYKIYGGAGWKFADEWLLSNGNADYQKIEKWAIENGWDENDGRVFEKDYLANRLRIKEIGPNTVRFVSATENKSKGCRYFG